MISQQKTIKTCNGFYLSEYIVYPAHGVGQIVAIEKQEIAGYELELFVIYFEKDKMHVKVPVKKISSIGMRKLSKIDGIEKALTILSGRAKIKRVMWSRRAQEYEAKINSGELFSIASVVRDLFRPTSQPEQSYSERQIYELALDRLTKEIAIVKKLTEKAAFSLIETYLNQKISKNKTPNISLSQEKLTIAAAS